jgi:hypothetical protein
MPPEKKRNAKIWCLGIALAAMASGFVIWHLIAPSSMPESKTLNGRAWFTIDDGKTWFADDASRIPPFDCQGKPAVLCFVYKSRGHQPWVSHLLRYTPKGKKILEERRHKGGGVNTMGVSLSEVKKPGAAVWISTGDPRAVEIQDVKCPDGSTAEVEPLDPN